MSEATKQVKQTRSERQVTTAATSISFSRLKQAKHKRKEKEYMNKKKLDIEIHTSQPPFSGNCKVLCNRKKYKKSIEEKKRRI